MAPSQLSRQITDIKKTAKKHLQDLYQWNRGRDPIVLIALEDTEVVAFLSEGARALGMGVIILAAGEASTGLMYRPSLSNEELLAVDVVISDGKKEGFDLMWAMRAGVVPVMPVDTIFASVLKNFDPMQFEGNGFFYTEANPYQIFARLVAYTENIRFPEDRRILMKNVTETFA